MADSENTRTFPEGRLTRRHLLRSAGIAAAAGAITAPGLTYAAGAGPDAELFARLADFEAADAEYQALARPRTEVFQRYQEQLAAEGMSHPWPNSLTANERAQRQIRDAQILLESGYGALFIALNATGRKRDGLAMDVFDTPARTLEGALAKLRVAHRAIGRGDDDGDNDLLSAQFGLYAPEEDEVDGEAVLLREGQDWLALIVADLERLAGEAGA